jgi:tRNA G10  N-methylase Trm11
MNKYSFTLGRQPDISTAEIEAVFSADKIDFKEEKHKNDVLIITAKQKIEPEKLINRLGGTIKISELIKSTNENIKKSIVEHLINSQPKGKINFSISGQNNKKIGIEIKKELKSKGYSARYIEIKNTATILHNNLVKKQGDVAIVDRDIYITRAIQPIEELSKRDFERPGSDSRSGMLPPKLAKIIINLGEKDQKSTLLDPFCGSGTVLTEAAFMDYKNLIGSDISDKAINDTKNNLEWLINDKKINNFKYKLYLSDATVLDKKIDANTVDIIVSEPYMGNPLKGNESEKFLQLQAEKLGRLYTETFKSLYKILKKDGVILFIIPSFKTKDGWITIDCIEEIKKIGFEIKPYLSGEYLRYYRAGQHLARDIWRFKKTSQQPGQQ